MKTAVFALVLALSTISALAQSSAERFRSAKELLERREYAAALETLSSIERPDRERFEANNLDYLSARLHLYLGDLGQAASYFHRVRGRDSVLRPYATWHLAAIARETGNLTAERILLLELLSDRPDSLLSDAVQQRLAESYFESKDLDATLSSVDTIVGNADKRPRNLELLYAEAQLFKGDETAAKDRFQKIVDSSPNPAQPDDLALEAVKAIDLIEVGRDKFGKEVAKLSDSEHQKRAAIYQSNRDFAHSRLHLLAIVNDHPTSDLAPDAMYQIGRGYSQLSEFTEAVNWYERLSEQFPEHAINKDALLQLASAYSRLGKRHESVARYEKYIADYPNGPQIDRAYLNIIDVLRDAGDLSQAIDRADRTATVFQGKAAEAQAIFVKARIHIAQGGWINAAADLDRLLTLSNLGGTGIPGGTTRTEVTFLRGLVLEHLRRFSDAVDTYLSIPAGRNEYYGWLATERLRSLRQIPEAVPILEARKDELVIGSGSPDFRRRTLQQSIRLEPNEKARAERLTELRRMYTELPGYGSAKLLEPLQVGRRWLDRSAQISGASSNRAIASELAFLGLYDEAAPEFESSVRGTSGDQKRLSPDAEFTIARLYLQGDRADRAVSFAESFAKLPADHQVELIPAELASMLYPVPYADALLRYAPQRNVDPRFILSLMRQESLFRPNVKSVAAARGLMQFIPDTSNKIAGELGIARFDQNELYDPSLAILFGSQYVGGLFKLFPNQPDAVAASYNAGEDNMKRWYGRAHSDDPGRYVPEIAYAQSKDYVWRVMSNYRVYQLLYDDRLNAK